MKKQYLLVSMIAVFSLGSFFVSCSDDDDDSKSCTCTEVGDGQSYSGTLDPASYGATNCTDLARILNMQSDDYYYSCR